MAKPPEHRRSTRGALERRPLLCYITDRKGLPGEDPLPIVEQAVAAGIDLIQIRERDLPVRRLLALVEEAVKRAGAGTTRVLVNDRLDVAVAAGAAGVHLPAHGFPVDEVRRSYPELLIGASTQITQLAYQGGPDLEAVLGRAEALILASQEPMPVAKLAKLIPRLWKEYFADAPALCGGRLFPRALQQQLGGDRRACCRLQTSLAKPLGSSSLRCDARQVV